MGRFFKWVIILAVVGGGAWFAYKWYSASGIQGEALSLIPSDAVFCMATKDPVSSWKQLSNSSMWAHLQTNAYFAELTSSANSLDSLIRDNDLLFSLIGTRSLVVSAHMISPKDYDFLFLVDLQKASGVKFMKDYITGFSTGGYQVKKEQYNEEDVFTLYNPEDKSSLFIAMPGSYLVASYTKQILQASIDARTSGKKIFFEQVSDNISSSGALQVYLNYAMLPAFVDSYSATKNEYVAKLSEALITTSLDVSIENEKFTARGYTFVNDSVESYIKTLETSGKGQTEFFEIVPQRTSFCLGLGFTSFALFFENFEKDLRKDVTEYDAYRKELETAENYLKISVQENMINWIGDEVALIELQSSGQGLDQEVAVILKADNIEKAKSDLAYIEKMVRRRTPVKFKSVDHRGFPISYLGMKGFFKILLGKFFSRYDKPYYTVINNFVVFSNHPQTLESMIDDYLDKKTLDRSTEFRAFRRNFDDEGSVFAYVNMPVMFTTIRQLADATTKADMDRNKKYITCFRHIGFQLVPESGRFKTLLEEQFVLPEEVPVVQHKEDASSDSLEVADEEIPEVDQPTTNADEDPMKLPYIYVKNLNAKDYTAYYADSTRHYVVELRNGFKDGEFTEYFENGEVKMTGKFTQDKRDGRWRLYDENGKLRMVRIYEDGEIKRERNRE